MTTMEAPVAEMAPARLPAGSFETRIGHTTYVIGVYFNEKAKASYDDKAKKLIMNDIKAGNF